MLTFAEIGTQGLLALLYYLTVLAIARIAGKRLAGQITTFDLIILIGLAVVAQNVALREGTANAAVFVVVVLAAHRGVALLCARFQPLRHLLRGRARPLVKDAVVLHEALREEGVSLDELMAGLRKLGHDSTASVKLAVLEETGQISVVARAAPS